MHEVGSTRGACPAETVHDTPGVDRQWIIDELERIVPSAWGSGAGGRGWSVELVSDLYALLASSGLSSDDLDSRLAALERKHSEIVYSALIFLLSHLCIPPDGARRHWLAITEHRASLQRRLDAPVDLRVALVSYFMSVNRLLENPRVIEMRVFEQTREYAYRDALTGLRNFRFFSEFLPQEIARSDQYNAPLSLVMLDIDDFKRYNDLHGHEGGNRALSGLADLLSRRLRRVDVLARYGGEELALILPETPKAAAAEVAERLRRAVERHDLPMTISLGVATYPADAADGDELVGRADAALYEAKRAGKNRVRLHGDSLRSYRRVGVRLSGEMRAAGQPAESFTTIDVSLGGIRCRTSRRLPVDSLIEAQVTLPDGERAIALTARVVSVERGFDRQFDVALRFVEIGGSERWTLGEYLKRQEAAPA